MKLYVYLQQRFLQKLARANSLKAKGLYVNDRCTKIKEKQPLQAHTTQKNPNQHPFNTMTLNQRRYKVYY